MTKLLLIAALLCSLSAQAQIPSLLTQDPTYWYNQWQVEKARADDAEKRAKGLFESGKKSITGLQSSLNEANKTIIAQNDEITTQTKRGDTERDRADAAESALQPCQDENDRLKGKTKVGRLLRKARDGLAVVGGVVVATAVTVITIKLIP